MNSPHLRRTHAVVVLVLIAGLLLHPTAQARATLIPSWIRQFGTPTVDAARGVAVDNQGNSYVAGSTFGTFPGQTSQGESDAVVRKYDRSGTEMWTRQFGSSRSDIAMGVTVDNSSTSYVAGSTDGTLPGQTSAGAYDAFVIAYDRTGTLVWTRQFGSSADDLANCIAVDRVGLPTVAGQTSNGGQDAFLITFHELLVTATVTLPLATRQAPSGW